MQKKLIALAIAGLASGAAFADNASIYGVVDAAFINAGAAGMRGTNSVIAGGLAASRLGFNASEDLGNGTKAIVNLEYALDTENNTPIGVANGSVNSGTVARQQLLGLSGSWGTFATGYLQTVANDFSRFDVAGGSAVSALQNMVRGSQNVGTARRLINTVGTDARANSALAYISPNFSGFTVAVNYAYLVSNLSASTKADPGSKATLLAANYDNGPLAVGLVWAQNKLDDNTLATQKNSEWALGASYNLGVATLKGTYQSGHTDTAGIAGNSDKIWSLGALIPAGPGNVILSYAKATIGSTAANDDGKSYTLGYLYPMSKRTTAYVAYNSASNDSGGRGFGVDNSLITPAAGSNGGSAHLLAVGLNHKF